MYCGLLVAALTMKIVCAIPGMVIEVGNFCMPQNVVEWDRVLLLKEVNRCIISNYIKITSPSAVEHYVDHYDEAWNCLKLSRVADDEMYHSKRTLMAELRDLQLKTTHHANSILKCASISSRMPTKIMNEQNKEAKSVEYAINVWQHHLKRDLDHCKNLLVGSVFYHNKHLLEHLFASYYDYNEKSISATKQEQKYLRVQQEMLEAREQVINLLI